MDEAERCHRIAILDHGALVADGTPARTDRRRSPDARSRSPPRSRGARSTRCVRVPGVLSVAQIGNSLRVLTAEDGDAEARIREALSQAGLQAEVDGIAAEPGGRVRRRHAAATSRRDTQERAA